MKRTTGFTILIVFIILALLCAASAAAGWLFIPGARQKVSAPFSLPPSVELIKPKSGTTLASGQGLAAGAIAHAPAGLAYAELLVDGKTSGRYTPPQADLEISLPAFTWMATAAGQHTLSVRAVDSLGREGISAAAQVLVTPAENLAGGGGQSQSNGTPPGNNNPPGNETPPGSNNPPGNENPPGNNNPPEPDAPPILVSLDLIPDAGDAGSVTLRTTAAAVDDRGLDTLYIGFRSREFNGQHGMLTTICNGAPRCTAAYQVDLGPGVYTYFAAALDTAGQVSAPVTRVFQVLENGDNPPAAAGDDPGGFNLPGFPFDGPGILPGLDGVFNWEDMLAAWGAANPTEGEPGSAAEGCLRVEVSPQADGSRITLTALCALHASTEGSFLVPLVQRVVANSGMHPAEVRLPGWRDPSRRDIAAGTSFTWVDPNASCGASYRFRGAIDEIRPEEVGSSARRLAGPVDVDAAAPGCPAGGLGDIALEAQYIQGAMHVAWIIPAGVNWPELPQDGAAHFRLIRFDLDTLATDVIDRRAIPLAQLQAGGRYSVVDAAMRCGGRYNYTLVASANDTREDIEGWDFIHTQVTANTAPCHGLGGLTLSANPQWVRDSFLQVRINLHVPAGLDFPPGDEVYLDVMRTRAELGLAGDAQWEPVTLLPIDGNVRANGVDLDVIDSGVQYSVPTYFYRLALRSGRNVLATWPALNVAMPPGPPPVPAIRSLTATDNCPAGAPHCVGVEWEPYTQPPAGSHTAPAERLLVIRTVGMLDRAEFQVNVDATRFVDLQPYSAEYHMADGSTRLVCRFNVQYSLAAVDAQKHQFGLSSLLISTPDCDEPWNLVVRVR